MTSSDRNPLNDLPPLSSLDRAENIWALAEEAYVWGWPMVNEANRAKGMKRILERLGEKRLRVEGWPVGYNSFTMAIEPSKPKQRLMCCPNTRLLYGGGAFRLGTKGVIAQVPEGLCNSDNFWLYSLYDARSRHFKSLGKQHSSESGFYLIVGPNWDGSNPDPDPDRIPASHIINECHTTDLVYLTTRIFKGKDSDEPLPVWLPFVLYYSAEEYRPGESLHVDWVREVRDISSNIWPEDELRYVRPRRYFKKDFPKVLNDVPELPGEEDRYRRFRELVRRFNVDPLVRWICRSVAIETEDTIIQSYLRWSNTGIPTDTGWYFSKNSGQWPIDEYEFRAANAKSNLFQNRPEDTHYYCTDNDSRGNPLNGKHKYKITFTGGPPPAGGPCSITVYSRYHFLGEEPYSVSITRADLDNGSGGYRDVYAGPAPACDVRTPYNEPFCLYLRAYSMDGSAPPWTPPTIEKC